MFTVPWLPPAAARIVGQFAKPFLVTFAIIAAFGLGRCEGAREKEAAMEAQALKKGAPAAVRAAESRVTDTLQNEARAQERTDAIHAGPDDAVSGPECRLNRERLRQAGVANLPACR